MQSKYAIWAALGALLMAAIDSTAVGTILPTIQSDLGSGPSYPWLLSGFIVAQTITGPLFGRFSDLFGTQRAFLSALAIFLVGSVWVAFADSLLTAVFARVVQGAGAGGIPTLVYTVVASLSTAAERPRRQGMVSAVWGIAAILGPLIGAVAAATVGWRWVFLVNLPIGALCVVFCLRHFPRVATPDANRSLNWLATGLFAISLSLALAALMGPAAGLSDTAYRACFIGSIVTAFGLLISVRASSKSFIIDSLTMSRPLNQIAFASTLCAAATLYATLTFVPQLLQNVLGLSVALSGLSVLLGALGWVVGSVISGKKLLSVGFRLPAFLGGLAMIFGCCALAAGSEWGSPLIVASAQLLIGLGMGGMATSTLIAAQNAAPASQLGTVTAVIQLARSVGSAVGINALAGIHSWLPADQGPAHSYANAFLAMSPVAILATLGALGLPRAFNSLSTQAASASLNDISPSAQRDYTYVPADA